MVKNGCGQSGGRSLKPTVSEEWLDGRADFLHVDTNSGKLKLIQWLLGGCGQGLLVHETPKSATS